MQKWEAVITAQEGQRINNRKSFLETVINLGFFFFAVSFYRSLLRPNSRPNLAAMNSVTPSRNPLSPPPAITLSLELRRLRAAHARLARGHAANDRHTHAMLILLPLSLRSARVNRVAGATAVRSGSDC